MLRGFHAARTASFASPTHWRCKTHNGIGRAITMLTAICAFVGLSQSSLAQIGNIAINTVSYDVQGYIEGYESGSPAAARYFGGADIKQSSGNIHEEIDLGNLFPVSLKTTVADVVETPKGKSTGSVTVDVGAETGSLRVEVDGNLGRKVTGNAVGQAYLTAVGRARWQDTATLAFRDNNLSSPFVTVVATLELTGGMNIDLEGAWPFDNHRLANASVELRLIAGDIEGSNPLAGVAPYNNGVFARERKSTGVTVDTHDPAPRFFDFTINARMGKSFTVDLMMEVFASGLARQLDYFATEKNDFSADFIGSYGHTLRWGGITSVTNASTGEPIEDWIITSASDFNYANPFPVPEPAGIWLALLGMVGLVGNRYGYIRRRRYDAKCQQ